MNSFRFLIFLCCIFSMGHFVVPGYSSQNYTPGHKYTEERNPLGYLALNTSSQPSKYGWKQVNTFLQERDDRPKSIGRFKSEYEGRKLTDAEMLTLQQLRLVLQRLVASIGLEKAISFFLNFQINFSQMNLGIVTDLPSDDMLPYYDEILETLSQSPVQDVSRQEILCEILKMEMIEKLERERS